MVGEESGIHDEMGRKLPPANVVLHSCRGYHTAEGRKKSSGCDELVLEIKDLINFFD